MKNKNRDNCIILFITPVEDEKIPKPMEQAFGVEKSKQILESLIRNAYKVVKEYEDAMPIISYERTSAHPDLTWLDPDDPGLLEFRGGPTEERMRNTFKMTFFTGAKKVVIIDPVSPCIKSAWIRDAFAHINDRTVALGSNTDGSFYLLGFTQNNIKILDTPGFVGERSADILDDRLQKAKLDIFNTPPAYTIKTEEDIKRWNVKPNEPGLEEISKFCEEKKEGEAKAEKQAKAV